MTDKEPEWVIVPREPIPELLGKMRAAFLIEFSRRRIFQRWLDNPNAGQNIGPEPFEAAYKAMLAAAPQSDMVPVPRELVQFTAGELRLSDRMSDRRLSERWRALLTAGSGSAAEGGEGK